MLLATDLLICNTGLAVLEWDFPHYQATKVDMTKVPVGWNIS